MIKTYDRTPKVYSNESRDFQLFGHLFDAAFNASKTAADTIVNNQGTTNLDFRFVDLMCKTLGFNYKGNYTTTELLYVVKSFKTLIANKGSKEAIIEAINLLLSSQGIKENYYIPEGNWNDGKQQLKIYLPSNTKNVNLLEELFNYILPAGWLYSIITKTYKISDKEYITDIALVNKQRRKKTNGTEGINETELAKSNYIKNGKPVDFENIGEVPTNVNDEIISPVVNIGTVLTDENQTEKYNS